MERSEADFTVGNLYIFVNISKGTAFLIFFRVLQMIPKMRQKLVLIRLKIRGFRTMLEGKDP